MTTLTNDLLANPRPSPVDIADSQTHLRERSSLPAAFLCFGLSLAMHLPFIGITPLAGTEAHRVIPAMEMIQSRWWLVPTLFGKPRMTKPPLHHWLIALSQLAAGKGSLFVWRFPSALAGAALAGCVVWFAARWFGRTAGLIAGLCTVGMIAIWGQSQVADIDATNTLAAALTSFCGVELFFGNPGRKWKWVLAAGIAHAAMWMIKGPAGLPIVLGVWIWAAVAWARQDERRKILSLRFMVPLVIGIGIFGIYSLAARHSLAVHGVPPDLSGVDEGIKRAYPHSVSIVLESIFWMLPQLFVFALPTSFALIFFAHREIRNLIPEKQRPIATALLSGVLISWGVCILSGMTNPRYAYPTFPVLCPLAGVIAVSMSRDARTVGSLKITVIITSLTLTAACLGLTVASWASGEFRVPMIISVTIGGGLAAWTCRGIHHSWTKAWGLVAIAVLTAIPFGVQRHVARTKESGFEAAQIVRAVAGEHNLVASGETTIWRPEIFYYANVRVDFIQRGFSPWHVHPGTWVVLDHNEHIQWLKYGVRLEQDQPFCKNGKLDYYLGRYMGRKTISSVLSPSDRSK